MITFRNFGDCESDTLGTGSGKCDIRSFGDPRGIVLLQKRLSFDVVADTLDEATYKLKIAELTAFPFIELYNFEQSTPENEKNTSSTGILTEVRPAKPQFSFMFDKGSCSHKALYDKRGKNRWDLGIIFDTGVLLAASEDGSSVSGFDAGMLSVETFKLVQGTDPEMSTAIIQLVDSEEFNARHEFFTFSQLGFNMNRIDGVIETTLSYSTAPVAGTAIVLKAQGGCNSSELVDGMDDIGKWRLGGVQATATTITAVSYNALSGEYTFALDNALQAGDTVQLELFDNTDSVRVVEDAAGSQFKGKATLATIA